jgi:two-component system, NtrC family, response regulator AtoC
MNKVLVIDDDDNIRFTFSRFLIENGFSPREAPDGKTAIDIFRKEEPDIVLLDLKMPDMDGIQCMQELKEINAAVPVIIITAHGDVPTAVTAIQFGAYDFILKPPDFDRLMLIIKRAFERLELENTLRNSFETMFGKSKAIKKIVQQIQQVAPSNFSIILEGETGTGKSYIARNIHNFSKRADGPFVTVDMGVIPENLVESELFGHEKGAFTGAEKKKRGYFEISHNGTIFIDELQNMSLYVQSKLLRVAEEKKLYPLGSTNPVIVDCRIISAVNIDIIEAIKEKRLREDLFFRLGEFIIKLPPLRERPEDILFFVQKFFREATEELNKNIREISKEASTILLGHSWPGNVRELKNVIRRAVLLSQDDIIKPDHVDLENNHSSEPREAFSSLLLSHVVIDAEKRAIRKALELTEDNRTKAAQILRISHRSLLRKIKEYGI